MKRKTNMGRLKSWGNPHWSVSTKGNWVASAFKDWLLWWSLQFNKSSHPTPKIPFYLSENILKKSNETTEKELNQTKISIVCNKRRITIWWVIDLISFKLKTFDFLLGWNCHSRYTYILSQFKTHRKERDIHLYMYNFWLQIIQMILKDKTGLGKDNLLEQKRRQ